VVDCGGLGGLVSDELMRTVRVWEHSTPDYCGYRTAAGLHLRALAGVKFISVRIGSCGPMESSSFDTTQNELFEKAAE